MRLASRFGALLVVLMAFGVNAATAASTTIVISEFRVRGPNGAADEFVELFNLSPVAVDISGYKIRGSNNAGTITDRATIPAATVLGSGCHYLVTNSSASGGPYSGSVPGDQTYTTGFTDDGGIAVTLGNNTVVDMVGMSLGSAFKEGTPLASLGTSNLDRGYERKPGGAGGSTQDTDNNSADFALITPSLPQNRNSTCLSIAGPLTGVGNANPSTVPAGGNSLLTVAVTPATSPASTGLAVVIDLSAIGGSLTQTMFDDGTNGDVTPADNTFSFLATVAISTTQGLKSMPYTISDQQARTFNAGINLTVLEPVPTRRATWGKLKFIYR